MESLKEVDDLLCAIKDHQQLMPEPHESAFDEWRSQMIRLIEAHSDKVGLVDKRMFGDGSRV